ncbi:uncharacterized protein HaLaN_27824, partial [Haematococcus lacustris]
MLLQAALVAKCMLRGSVPGVSGGLAQAGRAFSDIVTMRQSAPEDYSIVMKKAAELAGKDVQAANDKEVGIASGAPMDTYKRQVRIFCSAKTASQSGLARTLHNSAVAPQWKIGFDTTAKWENPLMGWTSTSDTLENVGRASLFFYTKEQAIAF